MKLTDISKTALREAINKEAQDTGFLTEDITSIIAAQDGNWSQPMTQIQLTEQIDTWLTKK
jgi:hypothetical protein